MAPAARCLPDEDDTHSSRSDASPSGGWWRAVPAALAALAVSAPAALAAAAAPDAVHDVANQANAVNPLGLLDLLLVTLMTYWLMSAIYNILFGRGGPADPTSSQQRQQKDVAESSQAHIRSYVDLSEKARNNPDWVDFRNRSLATNATYSVQIAVKEALPRIHALLHDLPAVGAGPSGASAAARLQHLRDVDPVAALAQDIVTTSKVDPHCPLSDSDLHRLEMRVAEAVAEHAALEQIQMVLKVAHEAADTATAGANGGDGSDGASGGGRRAAGR